MRSRICAVLGREPALCCLPVALAEDDACIALLSAAVPEFGATLAAVVSEDEGIGPFEAMSRFAVFAVDLLEHGKSEVARRAFAAIELLAASDTARLPLASELVAEFVEAIGTNARAVETLGPATRNRLSRLDE